VRSSLAESIENPGHHFGSYCLLLGKTQAVWDCRLRQQSPGSRSRALAGIADSGGCSTFNFPLRLVPNYGCAHHKSTEIFYSDPEDLSPIYLDLLLASLEPDFRCISTGSVLVTGRKCPSFCRVKIQHTSRRAIISHSALPSSQSRLYALSSEHPYFSLHVSCHLQQLIRWHLSHSRLL